MNVEQIQLFFKVKNKQPGLEVRVLLQIKRPSINLNWSANLQFIKGKFSIIHKALFLIIKDNIKHKLNKY